MAQKQLAAIVHDLYHKGSYDLASEDELCSLVDKSLKSTDFNQATRFRRGMVSSYDDLVKLDTPIIASLLEGLYAGNPDVIEMNRFFWEEDVAPADLIRKDFDQADFSLFWGKSNQNERDLLIRAIPGHAHAKHCAFHEAGQIYPNTMTNDVVDALLANKKKYGFKSFDDFSVRSQDEINDVMYFMESLFDGNSLNLVNAVNRNKKNLSNINVLKGYTFNLIEWMRGFYFAAHMDNYGDIRKQVSAKYGMKMGGGSSYAVDVNKLRDYNISLKSMAEIEYNIPLLNKMDNAKRIELFKEMDIIVADDIDLSRFDPEFLTWDVILDMGIDPKDHSDKDIRNIYIREEKGAGLADDIAIFLSAFMPQTFTNKGHYESEYDPMSRFMAAFFADKIDTLEKGASIILPGGQDEIAGKYINHRFKAFCDIPANKKKFNIWNGKRHNLVSNAVLVDYTAASAITDKDIHSSQRYFLMSRDCKNDGIMRRTCALKEYMKAVYTNAYSRGIDVEPIIKSLDTPHANISIGFSRIPLADVLKTMHERLEMVYKPNMRENNLRNFYS